MSLSAAQIKAVKALSSKKGRDESGLFVVEGEKLVSEALASDFEVVQLWRRDEIGEAAMARISQLSTPSPVLALVRIPSGDGGFVMDGKLNPGGGLYLALDSIRDPGNLGTILRIADWFGIKGIAASSDTVDLYSPKVVQATMGAIFRVPFAYVSLPDFCIAAKNAEGTVYGTFLDGDNIYTTTLQTGESHPAVIVIGNEAHGISKEVAAHCDAEIRIPSWPGDVPTSESLNAAIATAVTVAEFRRRLNEK